MKRRRRTSQSRSVTDRAYTVLPLNTGKNIDCVKIV